MQSEAVLCAPRLSLQYQSALCISNHIFGRMSIKPLPLFAFSFIFSFSPGAALLCCCRLHIILCLRVPQRCILAVGSQKRCMRAAFHQPCVIKHGDGIAKYVAGQPMRNVNGRFALHKGIEAAVNLVLRNRIQRRRRFVQHHRQNQLPGGNALFDTIDHRLWYGLCGTGQLYPALKSTA